MYTTRKTYQSAGQLTTSDRVLGSVATLAKTFSSTAAVLEVAAGGNANDAEGGTGTNRLEVSYVDENGTEQTVEVQLAGASAAEIATDAHFVTRVRTTKTGETFRNSNDIIIKWQGTANYAAYIDNQQHAIDVGLWIPTGKQSWLTDITISGEATPATFNIIGIPFSGIGTSPIVCHNPVPQFRVTDNYSVKYEEGRVQLLPGYVYYVHGVAETGTVTATVTIGYTEER
jgi:hypothetical protein